MGHTQGTSGQQARPVPCASMSGQPSRTGTHGHTRQNWHALTQGLLTESQWVLGSGKGHRRCSLKDGRRPGQTRSHVGSGGPAEPLATGSSHGAPWIPPPSGGGRGLKQVSGLCSRRQTACVLTGVGQAVCLMGGAGRSHQDRGASTHVEVPEDWGLRPADISHDNNHFSLRGAS